MSSTLERGTITRLTADARKAFVEVPKLGLGVEFGPCDVAWQSPATEPSTGVDAHQHALPGLAVGQRVIVGTIHGIPDDVVILGIIG